MMITSQFLLNLTLEFCDVVNGIKEFFSIFSIFHPKLDKLQFLLDYEVKFILCKSDSG